jgi:catechol 2,3-dioxygenase-like lactoylglutathione lyase family enzyme
MLRPYPRLGRPNRRGPTTVVRMTGIGELSGVALDCPDPAALAAFYSELTGLPVVYTSPDWCSIGERVDSPFHLSFQRSPQYRPPTWPDPHSSMQAHLHVRVPSLEAAEQAAVGLGAKVLRSEEDSFRVMADPAGHIFCLCPARP